MVQPLTPTHEQLWHNETRTEFDLSPLSSPKGYTVLGSNGHTYKLNICEHLEVCT